jgi:Tfp pilus assembly protein PilX
MQKLIHYARAGAWNDRGSALIASIAMSIIMAIGGLGYLLILTNTLNNDTEAYNNDKAFHAAESGALIAYKWLENVTSDDWTSAAWSAVATSFQNISINNMQVDVAVTFTAGPPKQAVIKAAAYNDATHNASTFKKRIVITAQAW